MRIAHIQYIEMAQATTGETEMTEQANIRVAAMIAGGVFHGDMCDLVREKFNCTEVEIDDEGNIWIANPQRGHWLSADHTAEFADWAEKQ